MTVNGKPQVFKKEYTIDGREVDFKSPPPSGSLITIARQTATERLVSWADASVLKAADLTLSQVQQLHIIEEGQDWSKINSIVQKDGVWDARSSRIVNLADPIEDNNAVTKGYMHETEKGFIKQNETVKASVEKLADQVAADKVTTGNLKNDVEVLRKTTSDLKDTTLTARDSAIIAQKGAETALSQTNAVYQKTNAAYKSTDTLKKQVEELTSTNVSLNDTCKEYSKKAQEAATNAQTAEGLAEEHRSDAQGILEKVKNIHIEVSGMESSAQTEADRAHAASLVATTKRDETKEIHDKVVILKNDTEAIKNRTQEIAVEAQKSANVCTDMEASTKTSYEAVKGLKTEIERIATDVNVFVPHTDAEGYLSWTNKAGLPNPPPFKIKGEKGEKGEKGDVGASGDYNDLENKPILNYNAFYEKVQNLGVLPSITNISVGELGYICAGTVNASTTINISKSVSVGGVVVTLILNLSGSYSVTWNSNILWSGGSAPELTSGINIINLISIDNSSVWYGMSGGSEFA